MKLTEIAHRWSLVPLRLIVGFGFLAHGLAKWNRGPEKFARLLWVLGIPAPLPTAWMVTMIEIGGGLALLAGAFVLLTSIPLIASMLVAMFTIHVHYGFSAVNTIGVTAMGPVLGPPGYEINLLYIAALIALACFGATPASVDAWLTRRRRAPRLEMGRATASRSAA